MVTFKKNNQPIFSIITAPIFFLLTLHSPLIGAAWFGEIKESNTAQAILNRIKPIGQVTIEGAALVAQGPAVAATPAQIGKSRYEASCKVCHGPGIAGAPKFQNATDWKSRAGVGMNGMLAIAIKGKGGMPPKGTCMSCTDDELKAAIQHMLPK